MNARPTVHVLIHSHRHGQDVSVHATHRGAIEAAAGIARRHWREVAGEGSYLGTIPTQPPADDQLVIRLYFDALEGRESYEITAHEVLPARD